MGCQQPSVEEGQDNFEYDKVLVEAVLRLSRGFGAGACVLHFGPGSRLMIDECICEFHWLSFTPIRNRDISAYPE